ncbi:hypothetical protein PFICI_03633 [Pestalotiopsis fici W106-1]|uniref:F-box domain-containing protein n=1 Tax=Pestalotiopsis fici (strain W106-1 / CGMCC3.15140) TaxID=1229662 RepID=W3XHP9_PESFW|nr:uncharacterized protein PFICI_03633 [Pestalotiopsis fici W106-1]ETS85608.1 hypothetical protein PFICI_03633 [Pestalotiopsis fici W106-1]
MSSPDASCHLLRLAPELVALITSCLPNSAIKNLRLSCRALSGSAALRLHRVFLSPNPRNVEVFRAVADHEVFRRRIVEIIWDDALLLDRGPGHIPGPTDGPISPEWYDRACGINLLELDKVKKSNHPDYAVAKLQMAAQLPFNVSWEHYQELLGQQEEVIASKSDIEALRYGLQQFPALKRITITPAAHGLLFIPLYETPMIRALPHGFNYPIPRGWPTPERGDAPYYVQSWDRDKSKWRGFNIVTRELASAPHGHSITELVLDVHYLNTGLNCHVFDGQNDEYDNLVKILRQPGFSRLDLALLSDGQQYQGWSSFRNGNLRSALSEATDLQHINFESQTNQLQFWEPEKFDRHFLPLDTLLPVERWHKLRHFGLSNFLVRQDDLLALLAALPKSVRSVELGFLLFLDERSHKDLLDAMRQTLGWRDRPVNERPTVTILCPQHKTKIPWRYMWIRDAVNDFLYDNATNPFSDMDLDGIWPDVNRGAILRWPFLPALDEPY